MRPRQIAAGYEMLGTSQKLLLVSGIVVSATGGALLYLSLRELGVWVFIAGWYLVVTAIVWIIFKQTGANWLGFKIFVVGFIGLSLSVFLAFFGLSDDSLARRLLEDGGILVCLVGSGAIVLAQIRERKRGGA